MKEKKNKIKKDLFNGVICKEGNRQTAGITLIALVITIVVLIILASIIISISFGKNGLLRKASDAADKTKEAKLDEELQMILINYKMEELQNDDLDFIQFMSDKVDSIEETDDGYIIIKNGVKFVTDKNLGIKESKKVEGVVAKVKVSQRETATGKIFTVEVENYNDLKSVKIIVRDKDTGEEKVVEGKDKAEIELNIAAEKRYDIEVITTSIGEDGKEVTNTIKKNNVKVSIPIKELQPPSADISMYETDEIELDVTTVPPSSEQLKYESSDTSIVSIGQNGKMVALKEGRVTITVSGTVSVNVSAQCIVDVKPVTLNNMENKEIIVGAEVSVATTANPSTYTSKIKYKSGDESIATVDETTGVVTGVQKGSTTITASLGTKTKTCTIRVLRIEGKFVQPTLTGNTTRIDKGDIVVSSSTCYNNNTLPYVAFLNRLSYTVDRDYWQTNGTYSNQWVKIVFPYNIYVTGISLYTRPRDNTYGNVTVYTSDSKEKIVGKSTTISGHVTKYVIPTNNSVTNTLYFYITNQSQWFGMQNIQIEGWMVSENS